MKGKAKRENLNIEIRVNGPGKAEIVGRSLDTGKVVRIFQRFENSYSLSALQEAEIALPIWRGEK